MKNHIAILSLILSTLVLSILAQSCGSSGPSSPTNNPTHTPTVTFTATHTSTFASTSTSTNTATATATPTPTDTNTATLTPTETATLTDTETSTITDTPTITATPTITDTPTNTVTATITSTLTSTLTSTPTTCANYGNVGGTSVGTSSPSAHYFASQLTLSQNTVVDSINLYGYDTNSSNETVYLAIYAASGGALQFSGSFQIQQSEGSVLKTVSVPSLSLAAGTYNLVICLPTATSHFSIGTSTTHVNFDYGTYAGGAPPDNYSTLFAGTLFGSFTSVAGDQFYIHGCP